MKKIWPIFFILIFVLLLSPKSNLVKAETPTSWLDAPLGIEFDKCRTDNTVGNTCYIDRTVKANLGSVTTLIVPVMGISTNDQARFQVLYKNSAIGQIGSYITEIYANPPADFALWAVDTGQTLGFIPKQAMAQGIGFSGLAPLLPIWKVVRNVSYLLLAVFIVVIGFMVMLRKKIDPKTVVTVQNALPRIVLSLILITFSYAIVGLMVDLIYLLILFFAALMSQTGIFTASQIGSFQTSFTTGGFLTLISNVFSVGVDSYGKLASGVIVSAVGGAGLGAAVAAIAAGVIPALGAATAGLPVAIIGGAIGAILIIFLLALVLLIAAARIFIMLLMAYVTIILSLISAPVQLLMVAFPGSNAFGNWFKTLLANILVFPLTAAMLMLAAAFTHLETKGLWQGPLLVTGSGGAVPGLLGLGVLLMIPSLANILKEVLKPPENKYAGAPTQAISSVLGFPVSFTTGMVQTGIQHAMYTGVMKNQQPPKGKK